ncbi:MAG: hypothetical protein B7X76_09550, partial [Azorhizobium sp. 39-67-5]
MSPALSRTLNALGLLGVCAVLAVAFFDQLVFGDLPCPLCLLQRAGFVLSALAVWAVRDRLYDAAYKPRPG